jgi:MoaA/NifB/PqqE/SkfB family radical SAM enzyme
MEVTNLCNLKCPFCLTGKGISGGREQRHLTFGEAKSILDEVGDYVYLLQLYTWGEPLLNKDLYDIVSYAKTKGVCVMLSTNATAMNATNNAKLLDSNIDYVMVAVDGGSDATYAKYRVGGNYDKVLANIKDLLIQRKARSSRMFIEWQYIVFRHNEHEVEGTEKMAYEIGIDKFTPLPAYVEDESWLPKGEKYRKTEVLNPERLQNCSRPWTHLNVRADGGIAPCCYEFFKKDDFASLREGSFSSFWNNAFFTESRSLIKMFSKNPKKELPKTDLICRDCLQSGVRPSFIETPTDSQTKQRRLSSSIGGIPVVSRSTQA